LFRRKQKPPTVIGSDGTEYVAVPDEEANAMLEPLAHEAFELARQPLAEHIGLAMSLVLSDVVLSDQEPTEQDRRLGYSAGLLGYCARMTEFRMLNESEFNPELAEMIAHFESDHTFGEDWFATIMGVTAMLMNASATAPHRPDVAPMLGPIGIGYDMRERLGTGMMTAFLSAETPDDIGLSELYECWRFGHWYRAGDASLPDEALQWFAHKDA
jgi:hypothetical protein